MHLIKKRNEESKAPGDLGRVNIILIYKGIGSQEDCHTTITEELSFRVFLRKCEQVSLQVGSKTPQRQREVRNKAIFRRVG